MTATQLQGFTSANIAEVEAASKALRVTMRAEDYGALGIYNVSNTSGLMAAGLAGASRIFSLRWPDATRFFKLNKFSLTAGNDATAFAAGTFIFNLFIVRSFTVNDSVGTDITPTGNTNKLRTTGMGTTLLTAGCIRLATTLAVSGGTLPTTDTNPIGTVVGSVPNVAGSKMLDQVTLFEARPGEHPVILVQNEGLILQVTVPGTGTWKFSPRCEWSELTSY
jgi:hypothetical protein